MHITDYRASVPSTTNQLLDLLISGTPNRRKLLFPLNYVIKTGDGKLAITGDIMPATQIENWLKANCSKGYSPLISYNHMGFEDEADALLYKLTWG